MSSFVENLITQFTQRYSTFELALRKIQAVFDVADKERERIQQSRELTDIGKKAATERVLQGAYAALEPHERHVQGLAEKLAETRSRALEQPVATPETLAEEREIRALLVVSKPNQNEVGIKYFNALARGDDAFVRAVEGAPESFPLLSAETREKGEAEKLRQSPLASEISALEYELDTFSRIVSATETQLGKMEGRYPKRLNFAA